MTTGAWITVAALVAAAVVALVKALYDGRFRSKDERESLLPADQLGEHATLLQFSSAFCAPCRTTRQVLADVAERIPGVAHVELDAEAHLDVVRRLNILRTPTTLVLDADGVEAARASGAPKRQQVLAAVSALLPDSEAVTR